MPEVRLEGFFRDLLFAVFSPILMIALLFLLTTISRCLQRTCKRPGTNFAENNNKGKDKIVCISVVSFWLFQPDICHILFASLSCTTIQGQPRLLNDLDIVCWKGNHQTFINFVTIPGVLVYVIILPAYLFSVVYKNQELIELIKDKQDLSKQKQFQVE